MSNDNSKSFEAFKECAKRENWKRPRLLREAFEWKQQAELIGTALSTAVQANENLRLINDALVEVVKRHGLAGELQAERDRYAQGRAAKIRDGNAVIRQGMVKTAELVIRERGREGGKQSSGRTSPLKDAVVRAMRMSRRDGHTLAQFITAAKNDSIDGLRITEPKTKGLAAKNKRYSVGYSDEHSAQRVAESTLRGWWAAAGSR